MNRVDETMAPAGRSVSLTALQTLRASMRGEVLRPGDEQYEEARKIWNGMIDRRPALIARCTGDDDVIACVRFAREAGIDFTVRGGGHNVAGSSLCDDGLVIDLAPMREVRVDPTRRRVTAQGGATIGDVDRATQSHALAAPMGVVTETGIAGLTLGGGLGWLRRKHGLSCDALRSVEVVTADGRLVRASEEENADLFWGVRGGGGNFGIVTRFEYELYDVGPEVFLLTTFYPIHAATDVIRGIREFMATAPDEFSPIAVLAHLPPIEQIPAEHHGKPCVLLVGPWIGDAAEGAETLAPLRGLATPVADLSGPASFLDVQRFFDADYPAGGRYYWKSISLDALDNNAIESLIALNDVAPSLHSTIDIWFHGGAMGRVESGATAFADRTSAVLIGVEANWHHADDDERNIAWGRRCIDAMEPFSQGRMYLNFPGAPGETEEMLRGTYGSNYERLVEVKRRHDPENLFRTHQNILPAQNGIIQS